MSRHEPVLAAVATALNEMGACAAAAWPVQTMVVAVSGGPDSVCLFHALWRLMTPRSRAARFSALLHVAHLHHGLRGDEADEDASFVRELADSHGCPVTIGHADVRREAARSGLSIQVAARERRYQFLSEVADRTGASWIAVAHTADDQAETLLFRLLRGTGPDGLAGIPMIRDGHIVRPLLRVTRGAVLDYLERHRLTFRQDSSNADLHYTRNRLRAELLPQLRNYNPQIISTLARTAEIMAEERRLMDELLDAVWRESLLEAQPHRLVFRRPVIRRQPPAVQRWCLRRALQMVGGPGGSGARTIEEVVRRLRRTDHGIVSMRGIVYIEMTEPRIEIARRAATPKAIRPTPFIATAKAHP